MVKNYELYQAENFDSFFKYRDFLKRRLALQKLCYAFRKENLHWALAWSAGLFFRGIVDDFHDLDIVVESITRERMVQFLQSVGAVIESEDNDPCFTTRVFFRCSLDGVEMDIMSDFGMTVNQIDYKLEFSKKEIDIISINGMNIPIYAAEVQYLLYAILEDSWQSRRRRKREMISEFLSNTGLHHKGVFEKALEMQLTEWIKGQISLLIHNK